MISNTGMDTNRRLTVPPYRKRVGLVLDTAHFSSTRNELLEKVRIADELGFASLWVAESWGYELIASMSDFIRVTQRITIGAGIANIYSRSPAIIASAMATLDESSGGRILLGLGPSEVNVVEHWHGATFAQPVKRTREYVEIIRMILRGERVIYHGELFHLEGGFRLRFTPLRSEIPIYIAAVGPRNILQAGEIADGVLPIFWPGQRWPALRAQLDEGSLLAQRPAHSCLIAPYIPTLLLGENISQPEVQEARWAAAVPLAYHIGKMGPHYAQILSHHGFSNDVQAVIEAWQYGMEEATSAVSASMLDAVCAIGTPREVVAQLDRWALAGVDEPLLTMPEGSVQETAALLTDLMEALQEPAFHADQPGK